MLTRSKDSTAYFDKILCLRACSADPKAFEQSYTPKHNYRVPLAMKWKNQRFVPVITGTTNRNILIPRFHDARSAPLCCKDYILETSRSIGVSHSRRNPSPVSVCRLLMNRHRIMDPCLNSQIRYMRAERVVCRQTDNQSTALHPRDA